MGGNQRRSLWPFGTDFGIFWTGQVISTLGSSVTSFALPLLVFNLTGSSLNLALTVVVQVLPYLLFGLFLGAWVDRVKRKRLMILTDILRAVMIASIPLLAALGLLSVWWIYLVGFVNATLSISFDAASFAAVPSLASQETLVWANGQIQAGYSTAKVIGPLLAGALLIAVPLPMLVLVDACSFLVSAGSFVWIKRSFNNTARNEKAKTSLRQDISEGLRCVLGNPLLLWMTLFLLGINFMLPTTGTQIVLFALQWFAATNSQIGFFYASGSIGTVLFSLIASRLRKHVSFGVFVLGSMLLEGVLTAALPLSHVYLIGLLLWGLRGGVDVLFTIGSYSLTQVIVPDQLLGRVITFIRVFTWSTASVGALLGGLVIEWSGNVGLVYAGVGLLVCCSSLAFAFTPMGHAERFVSD
jgi:Transmembrane secretion effector